MSNIGKFGRRYHSDRGSQYAAGDFARLAQLHGTSPSMSRTGKPYDNPLAESFVATLKTECFGEFIPPTRAAGTARSAIAPRSSSSQPLG